MIGNEQIRHWGQLMGWIVSKDDEVTRNEDSRSCVTKRMSQVFKFPGNEGKWPRRSADCNILMACTSKDLSLWGTRGGEIVRIRQCGASWLIMKCWPHSGTCRGVRCSNSKGQKKGSRHLHWTMKDEMNFERNRFGRMFPAREDAVTQAERANPGSSIGDWCFLPICLQACPRVTESVLVSPRLVSNRPPGGDVCLWGSLPGPVGLQGLEMRIQLSPDEVS